MLNGIDRQIVSMVNRFELKMESHLLFSVIWDMIQAIKEYLDRSDNVALHGRTFKNAQFEFINIPLYQTIDDTNGNGLLSPL